MPYHVMIRPHMVHQFFQTFDAPIVFLILKNANTYILVKIP